MSRLASFVSFSSFLLGHVAMGLGCGTLLNAQDSKATAEGPRSFEYRVGGKTVGLSPPPTWEITKSAGPAQYLSPSLPWKLLDVWRCTNHEELAIRVFSVEKQGLKAAGVAEAWFLQAKQNARENVIVKADVSSRTDKAISGRDIEVDFSRGVVNETTTYAWFRAIDVANDVVLILYAEDSPVRRTPLEGWVHLVDSHVEEVRTVFDSFRSDARRKEERWKRGPQVEIVWRYSVAITVTGPPEWDFSRQGSDGGVVWRDPSNSGRDYLVEIDCGTQRRAGAKGTLDAARAMVQATNGRMIVDRDIQELGHGRELVSISHYEGHMLWHCRRVWQCGDYSSVHVVATVPLNSLDLAPPVDVQRESETFVRGVRISSEAW